MESGDTYAKSPKLWGPGCGTKPLGDGDDVDDSAETVLGEGLHVVSAEDEKRSGSIARTWLLICPPAGATSEDDEGGGWRLEANEFAQKSPARSSFSWSLQRQKSGDRMRRPEERSSCRVEPSILSGPRTGGRSPREGVGWDVFVLRGVQLEVSVDQMFLANFRGRLV